MRKTHKKILGFLSLGLVAAMTVFAATLPIPGAKAATSTVTDVIRVTVIGSQIQVDIVEPLNNDVVFTRSSQQITVDQQHAKTVTITGVYTDEDGVDHPQFTIGSYNPTDVHDTHSSSINLNEHGYGTYTITATGVDESGIIDEDVKVFKYIPATADIDDSDEDGDIYIDLDYEPGVVCSADVNVYLGGNLVAPPSPIHVEAPTTRVKIPVDGFATGDYTVITTAYNCPGEGEDPTPLPFPDTDTFHYDEEDIPVPDTGGLFMGLNISKTDYLLTAIIVFFAFATLALFIVIKGRKTNKRR